MSLDIALGERKKKKSILVNPALQQNSESTKATYE